MDTEEWIKKGNDLYHLTRFQEAVNSCDAVFWRDPDLVTAWNNKGLALGDLGWMSTCCVPVMKRGN